MLLKQTKIVATISDQRCDVDFIKQLFDAGLNVVRMNTAHAGREGFEKLIANVRTVSNRIAILMDTKGPEVRTTVLDEPIPFKAGDRVKVVGNPDRQTTRECISVSYPNFVHDLNVGGHILIDDGDLELVVVEKNADHLLCEVQNEATLSSRKSVNVPGVRINLPSLTEKDRNNILYAIEKDIDFIAHSFVRNRQDILDIKAILDAHNSDIRIIAKIENQEGVDNIDEILDKGNYRFTYQLIPKYQGDTYDYLYYNIFPTLWRNKIPEGSTFTIHFPKKTDFKGVNFYYGRYGESKYAKDVITLKYDEEKNQIKGTLKKTLPFKNGLTCYSDLGDGYFTAKHEIGADRWIFRLSIGVLVITAVLFVLFGRDEKIIPSIQYQPPEGMDSAVVGYVVDGSVDDKDVISLILYWADKGYLKMKEKGQKDMEFIKLKDIPDSEPRYQKTMFEALFKNRKKVKASSLQYKFVDTVQVVKDDIKYDHKKNIYTKSSKVARIVSFVLLQLPICLFAFVMMIFSPDGILNLILPLMAWILYFIGMFLACHSVDKWYAISKGARTGLPIASAVLSILGFIFYGLYYYVKIKRGELFDFFHVYLVIVAVSFIGVILTAFMKKRTHQCVEWMGYLAGLRDFIETAELDRMKVLAKDHPDMFYHILPYSMVFGLFDLYAKKLDALKLPAPDWYVYGGSDPYFHYYMMGHYMDHVVSENLTVVEPSESGGVGEFFSGGDGGFSGGGFGGGGGGSW